MKKRLHLLLLSFILVSFLIKRLDAQNNDWQPIYLLVTGANTMDGVEASFQLNTCNGEDIIFVKFFNHNEYPVKLEWFDGVFTQELKWVNKEQPGDKKTITLPARTEVKGDCINNPYPELIIKSKDFVISNKAVKRYSSAQLLVIAVL